MQLSNCHLGQAPAVTDGKAVADTLRHADEVVRQDLAMRHSNAAGQQGLLVHNQLVTDEPQSARDTMLRGLPMSESHGTHPARGLEQNPVLTCRPLQQ